MDIKEIKALADVLNKMNLSELEVCEGDKKIVMKRQISAVPVAPATVEASSQKQEVTMLKDEGIIIKAPFAGVFYASSSPKSQPFVKIGQNISKGDVVCIIEAMKLMNEITTEISGTIIEICAQNESIVEYGQTLLRLK
ncbi:MAG: hypothetical protein A2Y17_03345 [Clostridiales bacterium GWF2_38_85]|nr:MAG: hypothetical protein A2Y17_03345 [Clostridiales bacterium GWF2_38_85]HBL85242.1 acetyl-CoA carboxylase biotin carboxyl carrier protein subunit [Clostridiales bacterium]